ncbi:hypothetical protein B0T26DRAFT_747162 [Lasiosphaeria miniovina]|uniref:NAD(P)-binding domain-containing protein n=1 Tax=Lasiosphaeria miniovina TaxID=1954250 RepID=A0AA40E3J8_9PEZI|nr:uncharacterized protein B0T26DRAFT_747162 [Lasiosphaeria miniovina]KAK0726754.1 hypothetical protein B0T26DRAFT_747162 [Lasiosphaeria miniovina]
MKVILGGATGFVGQEVLGQLTQHAAVTSIVAFSRRPLPLPLSPKVNNVIIDDHLSYGPAALKAAEGAEACIWAPGQNPTSDAALAKKVSLDFTMTAARTFTPAAVSPGGRKFRFIYVSGGLAERDQTKSLWVMQSYRRIRGQVETELLAHAKANADVLEVVILKPGFILAKHNNIRDIFRGWWLLQ